MAFFTVCLSNETTPVVQADAYQQEGPMLTFFGLAEGRSTIDSWSTRVASFRVADVISIWREDATQFQQSLRSA